MKFILLLVLLLASSSARAVTIEGQTPSGGTQQVGVTDDGSLNVNLNGVTLTISSIAISGQPLTVTISSGAVTITTGTVTAAPVLSTYIAYGQNVNAGGNGFEVFPADSQRHQVTVINECGTPAASCGADLRIGDASVTGTDGYLIPPGGTYSPDDPASFQGELWGASTAPVQWSWIAH